MTFLAGLALGFFLGVVASVLFYLWQVSKATSDMEREG